MSSRGSEATRELSSIKQNFSLANLSALERSGRENKKIEHE